MKVQEKERDNDKNQRTTIGNRRTPTNFWVIMSTSLKCDTTTISTQNSQSSKKRFEPIFGSGKNNGGSDCGYQQLSLSLCFEL